MPMRVSPVAEGFAVKAAELPTSLLSTNKAASDPACLATTTYLRPTLTLTFSDNSFVPAAPPPAT